MKKTKKGLVAGSFDPITVGHLDVIERAAKLCDKLTVGVLINKDKNCMFNLEQRLEMVKAAVKDIENVKVVSFDGHMLHMFLITSLMLYSEVLEMRLILNMKSDSHSFMQSFIKVNVTQFI